MASSPAISKDVIYVGSGDNHIYALNASTGERVWSYRTNGEVASSPAVADEIVYVGSHDGNVYALNTYDGSLVWSYQTDDWVVSSPAVVEGIVYFGSYDHYIYAIGAQVSVSFVASGLQSGTSWSVTFDSYTQTSNSDTITFKVSNGTYNFRISSPEGYVASPNSGTITVDNINLNEQIVFAPKTETLSILVILVTALILSAVTLVLAVYYRRKRIHLIK